MKQHNLYTVNYDSIDPDTVKSLRTRLTTHGIIENITLPGNPLAHGLGSLDTVTASTRPLGPKHTTYHRCTPLNSWFSSVDLVNGLEV